MIVKIQRSLFSSAAATVLIYNQSRTVCEQKPLSAEIQKLLCNDPKGYFRAHIDSNGNLRIGKRVPAQSW